MPKTTFVKCLVPLLCVLALWSVTANEDGGLKLIGWEIHYPTGLIVAGTDTKKAIDNVPLGTEMKLILNQIVSRNTGTVLVMKVDSTGVPQEDPVLVPVEVDGNTATLYLSEARLERMDFDFIPGKWYLDGGSSYRVLIPHNCFVQTETGEGLYRNYSFLLNTRTQNKVDTINTFWDGSSYKTKLTACDNFRRDEENEPSFLDILNVIYPPLLGILVGIDKPDGPDESSEGQRWEDLCKEFENDVTPNKEKACQDILDKVKELVKQKRAEWLENYSEIPQEILDPIRKDVEENLEERDRRV